MSTMQRVESVTSFSHPNSKSQHFIFCVLQVDDTLKAKSVHVRKKEDDAPLSILNAIVLGEGSEQQPVLFIEVDTEGISQGSLLVLEFHSEKQKVRTEFHLHNSDDPEALRFLSNSYIGQTRSLTLADSFLSEWISQNKSLNDYLVRDYAGFRKIILDRLSLRLGDCFIENPADMTVMIAELMAYIGDYLAYFQDAVATEAFPNTARKRGSMKRFLRLYNEFLLEGSTVYTWIHINVKEKTEIPQGSGFSSSVQSISGPMTKEDCVQQGLAIFESDFSLQAHPQNNDIPVFTQDKQGKGLKRGATSVEIPGEHKDIKVGDFIALGYLNPNDASNSFLNTPVVLRVKELQYSHSFANELYRYSHRLGHKEAIITRIIWDANDALAQDLPTHSVLGSVPVKLGIKGNIVLARYGMTVNSTENARIVHGEIQIQDEMLYIGNFDFDNPSLSANSIMQMKTQLVPGVQLCGPDGRLWHSVVDLFRSSPYSRHFVVDPDEFGYTIRFGDGTFGEVPEGLAAFDIKYIKKMSDTMESGRGAIDTPLFENPAVSTISNLTATFAGNKADNANAKWRQAVTELNTQKSCFTAEEYKDKLLGFEHILDVATQFSSRSYGRICEFYIQMEENRKLRPEFEEGIIEQLAPVLAIGDIPVIKPATWVPIDISLVTNIKTHGRIKALEEFLIQNFFTAKRFGFGQSIYLSQLMDAVLNYDEQIEVLLDDPRTRFTRRAFDHSAKHLDSGLIPIRDTELLATINPSASKLTIIGAHGKSRQ